MISRERRKGLQISMLLIFTFHSNLDFLVMNEICSFYWTGGRATSLESHFHYWIDHNEDEDARMGSYIFGFLG